MEAGHYTGIFRSVLSGRRWIVPADVAAGATRTVAWLREMGALEPFVIAGSTGSGELPDVPAGNLVLLGTGGSSMMEAIRNFYEALHAPLPGVGRRRLDAWDPTGEARVFASFLDIDLPVGGRQQFGARPAAWRDLEDKTAIDAVWDQVGVARAPMRIVELTREALAGALEVLDEGAGIVITADNRRGWHGGAEYTRVAAAAADLEPVLDFLGPHALRARVMPRLEGIPCSIHGVVFPDYVVTVRPVEMLVLYEPANRRFRYGSADRTWEPPAADTAYLRDVAVRVGVHLRASLGYRGAFTIDGVLTGDGFLPTELNPRPGAGLRVITTDEPSAFPLSTMLIAGVAADWRPRDLEAHWRARSRDHRPGRAYTVVETVFSENESLPVRFDKGTWAPAVGDGTGTLSRGPAAAGGLVMIEFEPGVVAPGASAAPVVAAGFALADRLWNTGIGALEPAVDVRR